MQVSLSDLTHVSTRIGFLSFGGPAAQISLMHKEYVEDRNWLSEDQYLRALSFCMLLPGPEAMQLATYTGWQLRGWVGGLISGSLFVLPGALVILVLALAYVQFGQLDWVQAAFLGVKSAVVVIVVKALWAISKKALKAPNQWVLAVLGFLALFALNVPFPLLVLGAGLFGAALGRPTKEQVKTALPRLPLRPILIGGALWAAPLIIARGLQASFFLELGVFFSKLAVVTFGGAYAALTYMTQSIVTDFGWISTPQMMDALGAAETTPGPLILVTEFVAALAGAAQGSTGSAIAAAALALWVTFVPCFIWIFTGAPYIDALATRPRLSGALAAITASVVGVIANLSLWFLVHVLFDHVATTNFGAIRVITPDFATLITPVLGLIALAAALVFWRKMDMILVLIICALAGVMVQLI